MKYKHVVVTQTGGPQVLQVREDELPEPNADEVRVKILAAGIAFGDIVEQQGKAVGAQAFPFTPGKDLERSSPSSLDASL